VQLLQRPSAAEVPHVTWCLTGPLTFLPIHSAGLYGSQDEPKVFDYVVSSYTPTITALLSAQRRLCHTERNQSLRLLAVAIPGQRLLPGTVREVNAIQDIIQSQTTRLHVTRLVDREATVARVLQHMNECGWIHLACAGGQDAVSPTESAFLLIDGRLTLKEVMRQSFSHAELAVLSAPGTAKGDVNLPDEAIHLAAGMMAAGYRSVVATMWSIGDDDAPIVMEKLYTYLIAKADGDATRAAYALHNAVAHLRDLTGEREFDRWVPFIHLGICSPPSSYI
jgi:CHAT domain-containing protein